MRAVGMVLAVAACGDPEPPPPPPDAGSVAGDFAARCAGPGVVRCFDFDAPAAIAGHVLLAGDNLEHASIDPDTAASGAGSLRFDLPGLSAPNAAGAVWFNFADDLSVQFGERDVFFVQWRQRFERQMLRAFATTGPAAGWHQLAVGEGDQPGQLPRLSCNELEIVVEQDPAAQGPAGHHDCADERAIAGAGAPPYRADEWMTFQLVVDVGEWNLPTSTVELWMARPGEPQALAIQATAFTIDHHPGPATGTVAGARYGKLWLEPFIEGKDPEEDHATASTWYDDVIIARQWIGDAID
jgi:hypothetical protein